MSGERPRFEVEFGPGSRKIGDTYVSWPVDEDGAPMQANTEPWPTELHDGWVQMGHMTVTEAARPTEEPPA